MAVKTQQLVASRHRDMVVVIVGIGVTIGIVSILFALVQKVLFEHVITLGGFRTYRMITYPLGYIAFLAVSAGAQIMLIELLVNTRAKLSTLGTALRESFVRFFLWTCVMTLLLFIAQIPFYGGIGFIFYSNQLVLGILTLLIAACIMVCAAVALFCVPFRIIVAGEGVGSALRSSIRLGRQHAGTIIRGGIVLVAWILVLLFFSSLVSVIPFVGVLLQLALMILAILYSFAGMVAIYIALA